MLKKQLRRKRSRILHLDYVEGAGRLLFEQIVKMDLEGIVCKRKDSLYKVTEKPSRYWIKVKNSRYGQLEGREELFEERGNLRSGCCQTIQAQTDVFGLMSVMSRKVAL